MSDATLEFRIRADASQARGEVTRFQGLVKKELGSIAQDFAASTGRLGQFAASLGPVGLGLGATAGAAIAAGGAIFGLAKSAADAGSKFNDLSLKTGLSVETLSGLELQLKQSGTSMDALGNAAVFMQKNLGEAASGNKELQKTFAALGVKDVRAALADTDGTLKTLLKSLGEMQTAGERNAAGSKVMGRGFKELSVFLADTKGDLAGVISESERAGRVMSTEAARAADEFGDQLDALTGSLAIVTRNFGMEFVPEITKGMGDVTGALQGNANQWRVWGSEVANILRGLREIFNSEFGQGFRQSFGWLWELNAQTNPLMQLYRQTQAIGAQARAGDVTGNPQDLSNEMARLRSKNAAPATAPSDFFSPPAKAKREKDRKDELDKLKAFAKEWDFTVTALTGGRHNVGSAHYQGRAMDVSVRGKSDAEVRAFMDAARQAGYGVRDERTRPEGQKVWSGPHLHLERQNKAVQAATQEATKAFEEQEEILDRLAKAIADADMQTQAFGRSTVEQEIAAARMSLSLQKLTGPAAELAERMLADYEATLKARDAAKEHAEALDGLKTLLASTTEEVFGAVPAVDQMTAALVRAGVPLDSYAGQWARLVAMMKDVEPMMAAANEAIVHPAGVDIPLGEGPVVDPAAMGPPPNFSPHLDAIMEFKDAASSAFGGITEGFGSMLQAFLDGGEISGRAFLKMAKSVIAGIAAQAAVKAIFELAEGFAALANPFTAWQAPMHFTAAKIYGLVAAAAAVGALAIPGGKGSGSTAGGYASGGQGGDTSPRNAQFNYGGGPASSELAGGSRGGGLMGGVLSRLENTLSRLEGIPPGQVVTMGASAAREAIGVAVLQHSGSDDSFNDGLARNMRVA